MDSSKKYKIKITKNGPYIVTGGVPLEEKIITPKGRGYEFKDGRKLPQAETYALCRCGKSKNPPFCDGSHLEAKFNGEETASREKYLDRVERFEGPGIDLSDDEQSACRLKQRHYCKLSKGWSFYPSEAVILLLQWVQRGRCF